MGRTLYVERHVLSLTGDRSRVCLLKRGRWSRITICIPAQLGGSFKTSQEAPWARRCGFGDADDIQKSLIVMVSYAALASQVLHTLIFLILAQTLITTPFEGAFPINDRFLFLDKFGSGLFIFHSQRTTLKSRLWGRSDGISSRIPQFGMIKTSLLNLTPPPHFYSAHTFLLRDRCSTYHTEL